MNTARWRAATPEPVTMGLVTLIVAWYTFQLGFTSAPPPWIRYWFTMAEPVPASPGWVTSVLSHADVRHLTWNVVTIAVFGQWVERSLGRWRFVGFVLVTGYGANVAQVLFSPGATVAGASGVAFAAMTYVPIVAIGTGQFPRPDTSFSQLTAGQATQAAIVSILLGLSFLVAIVLPGAELTPLVDGGRSGSFGHLVAAVFGVVGGYLTLRHKWIF